MCLEGCRISPLLQRITRKNWGNGWSGTNRLVVNRLLRTKSDTRTNRQRFLWSSSKQRLSTVGRVVPREVNHFNEKVGLVGSMNCYLRNRMHPTPSALKASITKLLWWKDHLVFKLLGFSKVALSGSSYRGSPNCSRHASPPVLSSTSGHVLQSASFTWRL